MNDDEPFQDYRTWQALGDQCDAIEGLTPIELEQARRAFGTLGSLLGNDFLVRAVQDRHPFLFELTNLAPWTRRYFTWLASSLGSLSESHNFSGVVKRFTNKNQYSEAMSVVRAASAFYSAGFDVAFDPAIEGFGRVPDLELSHRRTRERFYVEVTRIREGDIAKAAQRTSFAISSQVFFQTPFLDYAGRVKRSLSERHLEDVMGQVRAVVSRGKTAFAELIVPGVLDMAVAPRTDRDLLDAWASTHGLQVGTFEGPPYGVDEVQRVRHRIRGEGRQLPTEAANILVIEGFNPWLDGRPIGTLIGEIAEGLYDEPHVFAAVVAGGYMGSGTEAATMYGQHAHVRRISFDVLAEEYLILVNRFCSTPVSPAALSDLYRAYSRP